MQLWMLLLIIFVGILIIGFAIDLIVKKKNLKIDPQNGAKNASDSERIYTEKTLDETRNKLGNDGDNW
ncbi:hypothetical protein ACFSTA_06995 [Ornithinibacillus salinisoli]|uniref:Uncharacterized protein n=1 Tax=Ornithinibacillus salinisoli TaxID=1848459 RepID=A0ABW4VX94_9BACI